MIADTKIIPGANKIVEIGDRRTGLGGGYQAKVSNRKKDRRKAPYDRRKSVRDGVIVRLSFKKDRRKKHDRRFRAFVRPVPTDDAKGSDYDIIA